MKANVTFKDSSRNAYYLTMPEVELSHGFCDMFLMADRQRYKEVAHSYILELKYLSKDKLTLSPPDNGNKQSIKSIDTQQAQKFANYAKKLIFIVLSCNSADGN